MDEQNNETKPEMPMSDACECDCGQCADSECACEDGVCYCDECADYPEFMAEEGFYRLRVKLGNDEFEFESSDAETMENTGVRLLEKTFGRYTGQGRNDTN
jgi:hypothetical protein